MSESQYYQVSFGAKTKMRTPCYIGVVVEAEDREGAIRRAEQLPAAPDAYETAIVEEW